MILNTINRIWLDLLKGGEEEEKKKERIKEGDSTKEKKIRSRMEFNFKFPKQFYSFLNFLC